MQFRQAHIHDIKQMSEIRLSVTENVLSDQSKVTVEMYENYLTLSGRGWVCEVDDCVVGFSIASTIDHSIWALFVMPQYEALGIGKNLIDCATAWLFEQGAKKIALSTEANTRADYFYKSQGWTRGEVKDDLEVYYYLTR